MRQLGLLLVFLLLGSSAQAAIFCGERITKLIVQRDGNIYFTTDKTCPISQVWCKIDWDSEEKRRRALSVLLAARATEIEVTLVWNGIQNCSQINPSEAVPESIAY